MNSMYKKIIVIVLVIIFAYLLINPNASYERIDIVGSTSVQPVAEKLADNFTKIKQGLNQDLRINVQGGGSGMGIRSVDQGITDIGMSSKELASDEKDNITEIEIGKEGIVVAVNNKNPISDLTIEEIRNIFNGNIKNWKDVGESSSFSNSNNANGPNNGLNLDIHVITREEGSGTRSAFEDIVMDNTKIRKDAIVQSSTESVKQSVSSDPGAIGFVSFAHMSDDVKALNIEGISPTEITIASGDYELQRPFLFLIKGTIENQSEIVQEFLKWIKSPEGTKIIEDEKIIPI
ncbi:MAG: phosphate ABC transporter substrate-binding protein [Methanobrevibacter sp.]|jgi:phosphate transport system substrate-binding protein|nr:phosphate ABC transporter substrate-binding protein [Methanobrevibacter sp.]